MVTHKIIIKSGDKSKTSYYEKKPNKCDKENALRAFIEKFGKMRLITIEVNKVRLKLINN